MTDQNAQYVAVATGTTNTTPGSTVIVDVDDLALAWEIQDNAFGDKLPIIPKESHVEHGKVLYRLKINAMLSSRSAAGPVAGRSIAIKSNRAGDTVTVSPTTTSSDGTLMVTLESRAPGALQLSVTDSDITAIPLAVNLGQAWYEAGFWITHYIIADENDAHGPLVQDPHVAGQHRRDFLYGARGVPMQGTGQTLDNRFVRFDGGGGGWHHNAAGHPDELNHPETAHLRTTDAAHGAFADVQQNHSIAVDPKVIPGRSRVYIVSSDGSRVIGERHADDTGGGIRGYHIDHFSGAGSAATTRWEAAGGDMHNAKVKFLGY